MKLDEIVCWYQKKIGTYDKQQWEKTVEQKILSGFTNVTLKNATLKTEFIDVDLVRGSSFPKAKPKQTLVTVIRLAILRYFFLPIYAKWWVAQTSPQLFVILLCLYISQMINWGIYTFHANRVEPNNSETTVPISELLIPIALGLVLSLIHSQIVATNTCNGVNSNRKRTISSGKPRERVRRRRRITRLRFSESSSGIPSHNGHRNCSNTSSKPPTEYLYHSQNSTLAEMPVPVQTNPSKTNEIRCNKNICNVGLRTSVKPITTRTDKLPEAKTILLSDNKPQPSLYLDNTLVLDNAAEQTDSSEEQTIEDSSTAVIQKKRNVNWDSPVHNYASSLETINTSPTNSGSTETIRSSPKTKSVRIDDTVREFYYQLVAQAEELPQIMIEAHPAEPIGDDDGFESLNGKSSSGEENTLLVENHHILDNSNNISRNNFQSHLDNNHLRRRRQMKNPSPSDGESCTEKDEISAMNKHRLSVATHSFHRKVPLSSESDYERCSRAGTLPQMRNKLGSQSVDLLHKIGRSEESSEDTDEEGDVGETAPSPISIISSPNYNEGGTSATDWFGITTNSEECSYSSEMENTDFTNDDGLDHDYTPTVILNPSGGSNDRINCTIWDRHDVKKAEMSVLDISSCIIERVEAMPETCDYLYIGIAFSIFLSFVPIFCRLCEQATVDAENSNEINYFELPLLLLEKASFSFLTILHFAFGDCLWKRTVLTVAFLQRLFLTVLLFFLFAVAERTFKQKFLYAKLFSHLTSSRRARKSDLPHFRLNKVRNIKTWLSVRSYLKRRGPQRSVDVIVSAAFMITLLLLAFLSVEWLKDSVQIHSQLNLEALLWSSAIGIFLLRFMTLGNKINRKYRSVSVLITEQINLYLQIEQKPKKKDELMVSNNVLKLATDLLKELESPFKISGLSANPYLYTTIKVVILSALSGVLSEMLGFKLKLHKIKIK